MKSTHPLLATTAASLACAAALASASVSQEPPAAQVDALFAQWDKSNSPGCSVAVMQDGEIIYKRGYGMADLDHGIANTPSTVFHVASVSKQFAAAAIALLAQEGRLSLDDPARKYVPELPDFGTPITIRQLVHHTSGLRDQWDLLSLSGWRYSLDLITDEDVMSLVKRQRTLNFKPGERYSYSNTGYTLLGQIVRKVTGKSLREFTTERFFRPLGMSATHFRDDHAEIVPNIAYGYVRRGDAFKLSVTNFDTVGATSLLTTVEDLAKWNQNLDDGKVGGEALLRQMVERGTVNDGRQIEYAFGLIVETYRGVPKVGHTGSDAGYRADLVRYPEQRFGIACLCNAAGTSPTAVSQKIADIYLAQHLQPLPPQPAAATVPEAQLSGYAGMYLSRDGEEARRIFLQDGQLRSTDFDDESATTLAPLGGSRFRLGERADEVEFRDGPGGMTVKRQYESPLEFERVQAYEPSAPQLAQYTGTYVSEEIELPYRIALTDGVLEVTSMKIVEGMPLKPLTPDLFGGGELGILRFTRDRQGRVSGYLVNTGRVVGFRFLKR